MIGVVATLRAKEGAGPALEAVFREIAAQVSQHEPGNMVYELFRSPAEPDTYRVLEIYRDQEALEAHRNNEGVKSLAAKLAPLKAAPTVAEYLEGIG